MHIILWKDIIDFKINENICCEVMPCHHPTTIIYKDNNIIKEYNSHYINGSQIKFLYILFNKEIPDHFKNYSIENIENIGP